MYFAEIVVVPAILFSPKIKIATRKTAIYSSVRAYFQKFSCRQSNGFCIRSVFIESLESDVAVVSRICGCILNRFTSWVQPYFGVHISLEEYQPITRSWFAAELSQCQQLAWWNSDDLIKNMFMPKFAMFSHNLHWHWITRTLLCDTMEVSMLHLAWLAIAQHVFQPTLTGRLELILRKIVSCKWEQRLSWWADFVKNCLLPIGSKELLRFGEKYCARGRKKMGPTCDCDISNSAIYTTVIYREYTVSGCYL